VLRPDEVRDPADQGVLHFGVVLSDVSTYAAVIECLSAHGVRWLSEPTAHSAETLSGKVGGKLADPSGNVIEVKYYGDIEGYRAGGAAPERVRAHRRSIKLTL
jgi:extradiol dioxygenase family protein